jgi:hypothetical protein
MINANIKTFVTVSMLMASAFVSCGKPKSKDVVPVRPQGPGLVGDVTDASLSGYWLTECGRPSSGLFGLDYVRRQLYFKDHILTIIVGSFKTKDCRVEDMEQMLTLVGSYQLGSRAPLDGSTLNYSIQSVQLAGMSVHGTQYLNMFNGTCGIKDFSLGAFRNVQDVKSCDYLYTAGIKPFTIAGFDKNRLALGNYYSSEDIGTTAEKRPSGFASGDELDKTTAPMFEIND